MDSEALQTFMAIHSTKGFSSAADMLGRSQPAISRRIALLEEELGVPLFARAAGGVVLSEAGRTLLPHAERVQAALRDAANAMEALRTETAGAVSIVAVGTLAGANLTPVLKRFAADHPKIDLSISTAGSAVVSNLVRRGEAVIGLRYLLDPAADIVCEHIASETMVIACSTEHRFAGKKQKSLTTLCHERWFAFQNAYDQRETFADNIFAQFQARGIGTISWTPLDSLTAMKRMIEAGLGVALMSENAIQEELETGSIATIPVADLRAAHPVYAVVRKGGYLSPAARHLLALLRNAPDLAGRPARPQQQPRRSRSK